jgi:hypothetical protein
MWYITALIFGFFLVGGIVYYARKEARKSARLNALKREIKERERANKVIDTVRAMPIDRVRDKLKQTK